MWNQISKASAFVSSVALAVIFAIFVSSVFMRYFLHLPLAWADELSVVLFGALIFFASAFALRPMEQVSFELVFELLPKPVARYVAAGCCIVFGGIFLAAAWPSADYVLFMHRQRTPSLNIPFSYVYGMFPIFLLVISLRMIWSGVRIALGFEDPDGTTTTFSG